MKTWMIKSLAVTVAVMGMTVHAAAQDAKAAQQKPVREIVVSLEDRKLALMEDGQVKKIYSVAVGKPSTPSPAGKFTIERRVANPVYQHKGRTVEPGPDNPVGTRWMGLSAKGYGIHGTNEPKSIGKAASHGCIRMGKSDLEELYALVDVGDQVEIVGTRNEETARLFEPAQPGQNNDAGKQAVQMAQAQPADSSRQPASADQVMKLLEPSLLVVAAASLR